MRDRLHETTEAEQQGQHHQRAQRTRHLRPAPGTDVDDRTHRGPGTGNAADQSRHHVADALPDQLAVGVVARSRQRVGHQRGKQAVHGAEQRENQGRLDGTHQESGGRQRELQLRQPDRHRPDHRHVSQRQDTEQRAGDQRHQRPRHEPGPALRPQHAHDEGRKGDGKGVDVDVLQRIRQGAERSERSAERGRRAQERQRLDQHDDDADAGHEAGHHHVRRISHEAAEPQHPQQHLQQPAHHHHGQGFGQVGRVAGDDHRHGHRHGRRRSGNLRPGATEHRGEEAHRDGAVQAGGRAQSRRHAERQRHRQRHHRGGEPPEQVPAQRIEVVLHRSCLRRPDTDRVVIAESVVAPGSARKRCHRRPQADRCCARAGRSLSGKPAQEQHRHGPLLREATSGWRGSTRRCALPGSRSCSTG